MVETQRERRKRLAAAAKNVPMERCVYVLPSWMVDRVLDEQERRVLPSEVATARILLDEALAAKGLPPGAIEAEGDGG